MNVSRQIDLPLGPMPVSLSEGESKFQAFHAANPQVYESLLRLALAAQRRGLPHCGIRMLWEVMRWELLMTSSVQDPNPSQYRLNDHYHSRYARLLTSTEPSLKGFFQTRTLKT